MYGIPGYCLLDMLTAILYVLFRAIRSATFYLDVRINEIFHTRTDIVLHSRVYTYLHINLLEWRWQLYVVLCTKCLQELMFGSGHLLYKLVARKPFKSRPV